MFLGWPRLLLSRAGSSSDTAQAFEKAELSGSAPGGAELAAQRYFLFGSPTHVLTGGTKESSGSPLGAS